MPKRTFSGMSSPLFQQSGVTKRVRSSKVRKAIRRMSLPQETKYYETQLSNGSLTTAPGVSVMNTINVGDNFNERNGRQIMHKYFQYNFSMLAAAALTAPTRYDLWVVLDRQPNATTAGFQDIFDASTIGAPYYMKNIKTNQERFKILKHHTGLVGVGAAYDNIVSDFIDLSKLPDRDRTVRYQADIGAPIPSTNAILVTFASATAVTNVVGFNGGFRYAFVE